MTYCLFCVWQTAMCHYYILLGHLVPAMYILGYLTLTITLYIT